MLLAGGVDTGGPAAAPWRHSRPALRPSCRAPSPPPPHGGDGRRRSGRADLPFHDRSTGAYWDGNRGQAAAQPGPPSEWRQRLYPYSRSPPRGGDRRVRSPPPPPDASVRYGRGRPPSRPRPRLRRSGYRPLCPRLQRSSVFEPHTNRSRDWFRSTAHGSLRVSDERPAAPPKPPPPQREYSPPTPRRAPDTPPAGWCEAGRRQAPARLLICCTGGGIREVGGTFCKPHAPPAVKGECEREGEGAL